MRTALVFCTILVLASCTTLNRKKGEKGNDIEKIKNECKNRKTKGDEDTIVWFNKCIVEVYGFIKEKGKDEWSFMPSFRDQGLGDEYFTLAAEKAKAFFERNNDWAGMLREYRDPRTGKCPDLLTITAARYLFVTHVLFISSNGRLRPCDRLGPLTVVPAEGSCYPAPYGSATCSSDYDVGLVGPDSGRLTAYFNEYFMTEPEFKKPSEHVFDTNVYAFTLEFAMPSLFSSLPDGFASTVAQMNDMPKYQMQELASALFKMYKYDVDYYKELLDIALTELSEEGKPTNWRKLLRGWVKQIEMWNHVKETKSQDRAGHNEVYQMLVKEISMSGGLLPNYMAQVGFALLYAAEAYHTRGAIRHVVGVTQMKSAEIKEKMRPLDYWVSMLENWGDSMKEVHHCSEQTLPRCLLKMSKYVNRMFNAMTALKKDEPGEPAVSDLDSITLDWVKNYRKAGKSELDDEAMNPFMSKVSEYCLYKKHKPRCKGCITLSDCLDSVQTMVKHYHYRMIYLTNKGGH